MSYIDALYDREADVIRVVERVNGNRKYVDIKPPYTLYYPDKAGDYTSIFGQKLTKFQANRRGAFFRKKEELEDQKVFESDTNVLFRALYDHYHGASAADLHIGFFDIEVDYDPDVGFASPENCYAPINAISIYMSWLGEMFTLAIPPKTITWDEAKIAIVPFDNTYIFHTERELLETFLEMIDDVDVFTGWNSTGFDIPYLVSRIIKVLGEEYAKKLCLWDREPVRREYEKFNKTQFTYDLVGRIHLDYLELYQKNTYQELHSYKLDFVGELEVGENKTLYEGSLHDLYNKDFQKFVEYNRQDTMLLVKIDEKKKFIALHNQLAHTICVDFKTTMGSVAIIDQAIVNESHERGLIVFDKRGFRQEGKAAGAYVRDPVTGLHKWVGACDINSLYPSAIRALNMSPETVVGQIRSTMTRRLIDDRLAAGMSPTEAWHEMFGTLEYQEVMKMSDVVLTVDFDKNGKPGYDSKEMTASDIYKWIFNPDNHLCISANGTIFRTDIEGVIPGLLAKWYADRKSMKKKAGVYFKLAAGIEIDEDLAKQLEAA